MTALESVLENAHNAGKVHSLTEKIDSTYRNISPKETATLMVQRDRVAAKISDPELYLGLPDGVVFVLNKINGVQLILQRRIRHLLP